MAAPMDTDMCENKDRMKCEIEATVVTGFEQVARTEAMQKISYSKVRCERGRIFIMTPIESVRKVLELSSIDNCYVVMSHFTDLEFSQNELEVMGTIRQLVKRIDWEMGLRAWQQVFSFDHQIDYKPDSIPEDLGEPVIVRRPPNQKKPKLDDRKSQKRKFKASGDKQDPAEVQTKDIQKDENGSDVTKCPPPSAEVSSQLQEPDPVNNSKDVLGEKQESANNESRERLTTHNPEKLTFRVTCNRTGNKHCFQSMCAAANFGGAIHKYFNWNIDMKKFDLEVILNIDNSKVYVAIALTKESLHRRNISHFGPTTLRPTIAFNMLRMCNIRPGDVICDPMCGGGTIPIEASINWPQSVHICGEIHELGAARSRDNFVDLNRKRMAKGKSSAVVDVVRWDTCKLPLQDSSVDVFIADLPFGKRIGHKVDNWKLYPASMLEMARVCRPDTGRACFLTHDKRCMIKTMQALKKFWRQVRSTTVNIGGLSSIVFLMYRTANIVTSEDKVPTKDSLFKLPGDMPTAETMTSDVQEKLQETS